MKKLYSTYLVAFFALVIMACQSEEIEEDLPAAVRNDSSTVMPTVAPATQTDAALVMPAKNPAHGQPFHDCSIAVGAPLANRQTIVNPSAQSLPPGQSLPAVPPLQPVLPASPSGVKLNPAHGKPGHRCEIAVGAPLI
ncbi:MAG TPA: hypothetical protein VK625_04375 [Flavitalea sp.]|nr:hypothetical protein [Flavitalea sp.]